MIGKLLYRLTARRPMRLIDINGEPYLERYWLGRVRLFGRECTAYLHHFVSGDGDRKAHDHPFRAVSFILSGSYLEERVTALSPVCGYVAKRRRIRWFNKLWPMDFHRVIRYEGDVWTLFIHGARLTAPADNDYLKVCRAVVGVSDPEKEWGFLERVEGGIDYRQPYDVSATKDWHLEAKNRDQVYTEFYIQHDERWQWEAA
jgi:hypothetical protein